LYKSIEEKLSKNGVTLREVRQVFLSAADTLCRAGHTVGEDVRTFGQRLAAGIYPFLHLQTAYKDGRYPQRPGRALRNANPMDGNKQTSVSKVSTNKEVGEFWDTHDFADFDDPDAPDVAFEVSFAVPVGRVVQRDRARGQKRGVAVEHWSTYGFSEAGRQV
jgi:hypothetical protein